MIQYLFYVGLVQIALTLVRVLVFDDLPFRVPPPWPGLDVGVYLVFAIALVLPFFWTWWKKAERKAQG